MNCLKTCLLMVLFCGQLFSGAAETDNSGDNSESPLKQYSGRVPREKYQEASATSASGRIVPAESFVAGEALIVRVYGDPEAFINGGYPINAAGYVDFPIIGKALVSGLSRTQVESLISEKMANYLKDTHVAVMPAIRITFLGNFKDPGLRYINPDEVLWDAFLRCGGPAAEKDIEDLKVMRGETILSNRPLVDFSSGLTLREAGIQSGDIFRLPIPSDKDFWFYFKDIVVVTASLASAVASVLNVYIILNYTTFPAR